MHARPATPARSLPLRPRANRARRLCLEALERRDVPTVSVTLASGVITIQGDSWRNDAVVTSRPLGGDHGQPECQDHRRIWWYQGV